MNCDIEPASSLDSSLKVVSPLDDRALEDAFNANQLSPNEVINTNIVIASINCDLMFSLVKLLNKDFILAPP